MLDSLSCSVEFGFIPSENKKTAIAGGLSGCCRDFYCAYPLLFHRLRLEWLK